jgi:peptidoglycan/LPS O-acetylase OafA/YrhL
MTGTSNPPRVVEAPRHRASAAAETAPGEPRKFRPDIEGMRAFAVVSVVLYHAALLHVRGGFVGVDVFFVISGFLITGQLLSWVGRSGLHALPTFYTRRIRRLLPASAVVVVATILAARIWAPPLSVRPIAVDGLYTTFYGLNYRLAIEGTQYLNAGAAASPLQHFWSLAVEEQFYFCWPILIVLVTWLGRRRRRRRHGLLLGAVLAAIVVVSFRFSMTVTKSDAPWAYFSWHTRAWELALGALVAVAASRLARLPAALMSLAGWAGLTAMFVSAFVYSDSTAYPGSAATLPVIGAAVLIASGCGPRRSVERLLDIPVLQHIGRVSYSWYLWHWPMLTIAPMAIGHPLTQWERWIVVAASLVAAILTYFLVENPARSLNLPNLRWFAGGALLSGTVIVVAALIMTNLPQLTGSGRAVTLPSPVVSSSGTSALALIRQAEQAGLRTQQAPSNLDPEPSKAHDDVPISSSDGCHADYLVIKLGACVYGDPAGKQTVLLFGDSHMQQWQPAFDAAGEQEHWRVVNWTKSACPPADMTLYSSVLKRNYTECDTWRQLTLQRIATLKPTLIVMSGAENLAPASVTPQQWLSASAKTLAELKQASPTSKIIFLQDTPAPNTYGMPDCVSQHLDNVSACLFSTSKAYEFPARHAALGPGLTTLGFTVVDPQQWICVNTVCPAVVGNLLVWRDATHLSVEFNQWISPVVANLLNTKG